MRATDRTPGRSRDGREARARGAGGRRPGGKAVERSVRRVRRAGEWGRAKCAGPWAEYLWHRYLDAFEFLGRAVLPAATLLLCAFPFMLITSAPAGRSAVSTPALRLGPNKEAATDVGDLFASSAATSSAVTGLSWVFFVLGGLAAAGSVQKLYQQMFEVPARGARDRLRVLGRLAVVVGWVSLGTTAGKAFYDSAPVRWWIVNVPAYTAFWCFAMWFLLAGRVARRRLVPAGSPPVRSGSACRSSFASPSPAWSPATTGSTGRSGWCPPSCRSSSRWGW